MARARFIEEIVVKDPVTGSLIEMEVYLHENGGMFAIDSSFLDQIAPEEVEGTMIMDPFSLGNPENLYLEEN